MRLNIKTKIIMITLSLMFLAVGLITLTGSYLFAREYTKALQGKTMAIGKGLSLQLERLLKLGIPLEQLIGFEEQCQDVVSKYEDINEAMVVGLNGKILFRSEPSQHTTSVNAGELIALESNTDVIMVDKITGEEHYDVITPVTGSAGQHVANIIITFPLKYITQKTRELAAYSLGISLLALGLVWTLLYFALSAGVNRPLTKLLTIIREIEQGNDLSKRVEIHTQDEIGQLAAAFDKMTAKLQETTVSKDYMDMIITRMNDASLVVDPDNNIITVNKAAVEMLGYDEAELIGQPVKTIFGVAAEENPFLGAKRKKLLEAGKITNYETCFQTKEGGKIPVLLNASVVKNQAGEISNVVCTGRNITERKALEAQLIQSQKMEAIGQLAGGIAHDFNNILSGITGYTSLMKMKMEENNPFYTGISIIEKSAWRAAELTKQMLGFARGGKYEIKQIDLNKVVNSVLGIISETFDRAIAINTDLDPDIGVVEGDAGQLEQVLLNICLNARDAMPLGGRLTIETSNIILDGAFTTTHLEAKTGEHVMLTVSDTGTGIPPEIQGKIFDPFFTTKEIGKGTGMGLAMVYGIIKNHEGYISVYSELGAGTCFKIYFPAIKKAFREKMKIPSRVIPTGSGTILLVDDEDIVRKMGKTILEELGYQVIVAIDGHEACGLLSKRKGQIDLVLLDMIMPGMGGKETFIKIKEIDSQIKVLVCSGYTMNGQALNIIKEGAQGFVQKPFNMQQLAQGVSEALKSTS